MPYLTGIQFLSAERSKNNSPLNRKGEKSCTFCFQKLEYGRALVHCVLSPSDRSYTSSWCISVCSMEQEVISGLRLCYLLQPGIHFMVPSLLWKPCGSWEQPMKRAQWSWKTRQFGQSDGNNEKSSVMVPESNLQGGERKGDRRS